MNPRTADAVFTVSGLEVFFVGISGGREPKMVLAAMVLA